MIGFINVNKPVNMSSAAVVAKIKRNFKLNKVGHMGTLDPLACGVLPIAIGKATRMFDYFLEKKKTYIVEAEFGYETDSLDLGTQKIKECDLVPVLDDIILKCKNFLGNISQIPPAYSAKNINGEKAYNLVRQGKYIELKPVEVIIYDFKCLSQINTTTFRFLITCSSGTYVRSLIRDLAYQLNTFATVTYLERSVCGRFDIKDSVDLDNLLNSCIEDYIVPIDQIFSDFDVINVSDEQFERLKNGQICNIKQSTNNNIIVKNKNRILGICENNNGNIKVITYLLED